MELGVFYIVNITICGITIILNLFAALTLWRRRPLKPFQILLLNIVLLNAFYALNAMSTAIIFFSFNNVFIDQTFQSFRNMKGSLFAQIICLSIVFMAFQRLTAAMKPLKYRKHVTHKKTIVGLVIIYSFVAAAFTICSVLIWETHVDSSKIDTILSWLFIIESAFIIVCYIIVVFKIRCSRFHRNSIFSKQNRRMFNVAIVVSTSFLLSYIPIAVVLIAQISSRTIFQAALLMVWIDSFINPITIIFDTCHIPKSAVETIERKIIKKKQSEIKIGGDEGGTYRPTST